MTTDSVELFARLSARVPLPEALRPWQAKENRNMEHFCAQYEIPSFWAPDVFDGWRVADVSAVGKIFWRTTPRMRALATLVLWGDTPLHDLPSVQFGMLNCEVAARVKAALLQRSCQHTLYVDARHVGTLALRGRHPQVLQVIGEGSQDLQWLAQVERERQARTGRALPDDGDDIDWRDFEDGALE